MFLLFVYYLYQFFLLKFLKYKLIHLPSEQLWSKENLPDYLILVNNQIEKFSMYTQKDYNSTLSYDNV
jgi:hypothetical protein